MKYLPRELVILVATIAMGWSQQEEVVVIGQEGHQVVLPRADKAKDVSWWFGNSKHSIHQAVIIIQRGTQTYGSDMKGRVSLSTSNTSLIISSLNSNNFGYYMCEVGQMKTLYRLYRAKVTSSLAPLVVASQDLSLVCEVENFDQGLDFQWRSPQNSVNSNEKHLTIKGITVEEHGTWICVVTPKGQRSDGKSPNEFFIKFSITVVDLNCSKALYTTNGSSPHIPCYITSVELSALSGLKPITGSWTFKPHVGNKDFQKVASFTDQHQWEVVTSHSNWIQNTGPLKNNLSLNIASVLEADVGTYRFELTLRDITIRREVEVNMLRVHSSPDSPIYYIGDPFNISCSLVDTEMSSDLTINWIVPEKSSIKDTLPDPSPAVLSIPQATEKDKGRWRCNLKEKKTILVWAELNLKIESRPVNVVLCLSLCGAGILIIFIIMAILKLRQVHPPGNGSLAGDRVGPGVSYGGGGASYPPCAVVMTHLLFAYPCFCPSAVIQRVHCRRRPKKKYCRCKNPQVKGFYKT
nr:T-cell surface glycoprotein CD4-like isoform X2 [Paramormyrops kingsleyae]